MSISIKTDAWSVKDENGPYRGTAIFSSTFPDEARQIVSDAENAIETKGQQVIASIPEDYSDLVDEVSDLNRGCDYYASD